MKILSIVLLISFFCASCRDGLKEQHDYEEVELSNIDKDSIWFYEEMAKDYLLEHDGSLYAFSSEVLMRIYQMQYSLRYGDYYVFLDALAKDSIKLGACSYRQDNMYGKIDKEYSQLYNDKGAESIIRKACINDQKSGLRIKAEESRKAATIAHYLQKSGYIVVREDLTGEITVRKIQKSTKNYAWGYGNGYLITPAWMYHR